MTLRSFLPNPVNHQLKVRHWWGNFFLVKKNFSSSKNSETVEGSFSNRAIIFLSIVWEVTAHSLKIQKMIRTPTSFFLEQDDLDNLDSAWTTLPKRFVQETRTYYRLKSVNVKRRFQTKISSKTPFGRVKCIIDNPAENSSHEVRKILLGAEKIRELYTSQSFFLRIHPLVT